MSIRSRATKALFSATLLASTAIATSAFAGDPNYYSPQNLLIGATPEVQSELNYGAGITVGVIDTGGTKSWIGFQGYQGNPNWGRIIDSVCISPCSKSRLHSGNIDDNGHGTFVTSEIIGGVTDANGNGLTGVAPAANAIEVKVLNSSGSGSSVNVANGIIYAVDHGAKVLNLSLGPTGTPQQQAAFYQSLASAINYAASKNAVVVFAGGNSAQALAGGLNITGFTDAALSRMFFMGSTDANQVISSFSNTPGDAGFVSTTGQFYAYDSMWMMADGEDIWGASNYSTRKYGYSYITQMSGTSMAAPQGTGAAALLAARWPVLLTDGTLAQILEMTAQDLGAVGVDSVYGSGFLRVDLAMQPIGSLTVNTSGGESVPVEQVSSSIMANGPMGKLKKLSAALSNYMVFDAFRRDYFMNLSSLIASKASVSPTTQGLGGPKITASATHFADGSRLTFGNSTDDNPVINHPGKSSEGWFMSFTDISGSTMAAGYGFPASASFASALWGEDSQVSGAVYSLGVSNALSNLAQGGMFLAYGSPVSSDTRLAMSWSETQANPATATDWTLPDAKSFSAGVTTNLTEYWKAGLTFGLLDEQSGMLGTTYATNGLLSLGEQNRSMSFGVSSVLSLGENSNLLFDAAIARTNSALAGGLISSVTPVYAHAAGAAFVQHGTLKPGDNLSFSVRSPLRVFSGSASLVTSSVDANGIPTTASQRIGLAPDGHEINFAIGYSAPVDDHVSWNISVGARRDADNIRGYNDADILVGTKITF